MTREPTYRTVAEAVGDLNDAGLDKVKGDALRRWIRAKRVPALRLPNGEYLVRVEAIAAIISGKDPHEAVRSADDKQVAA